MSRRSKSARQKGLALVPAVASIFFIFILWQLLASFSGLPEFILPSPLTVANTLFSDWELIASHLASTFLHTIAFFALSLVVSLVLGLVLDQMPRLERFCRPLLVFSQTIPPIILYPLLLIWLGYGSIPRVLVGFIACFFTILVNFLQGLKTTEPGYIDLYRSLGARRMQILLQVKFPSALPALFAGLKIAGAWALISAVMSEWMGADQGLGVYMARSFKSFATNQVFAAILIVSLFSILVYQTIAVLEKVLLKGVPSKKEKE